MIGAEPQLTCGAQHTFGELATNFTLLDLEPARKSGADACEGIQRSDDDIRCAAHNIVYHACARVDFRDPEMI